MSSEEKQDQDRAREGVMFVLSSPSGAGKSTLAERLMAEDPDVAMSVSVTTRPPRSGEVDGEHYHFVTRQVFDTMVADNALLEWAQVHGNYYGTPTDRVRALTLQGKDVLFDVDWQGAARIRERVGGALVRIFVLPPSLETLRTRLVSRGQDTPEVIERRMRGARVEIGHWEEYDYVLVNDDLDHAYEQLCSILSAERLRRTRQSGLAGFIAFMLK